MPKRKIEEIENCLRQIHFKVETCRSVDPAEICKAYFGENKCLCVLHKEGKNEIPHWHFQGWTSMTDKQTTAALKLIAEGHSKKIASPKSRPVKQKKVEPDDIGYQYMMKEEKPEVVYSSGFEEEEFEELHEKSKEHVQELKDNLLNYLEEHLDLKMAVDPSSSRPKALHEQCRLLAYDYYTENDKMWPPNIQKLVLFHLAKIIRKKGENILQLTARLYISKHM